MNEFELIQRYFASAPLSADVAVGIGDDAAVLRLPSDAELVVSVDTMVPDVHFPAKMAPQHIASRALGAALSDLAAMGTDPLWFTLSLTLPEVDGPWLEAFSEGLLGTAARHGCHLIGGDTTRGPLCIGVQVHGSVPRGQALLRSGAAPGDCIFVTGSLGDGAAALAVLQSRFTVSTSTQRYLLGRFHRPSPRLREGVALRGLATAAIDLSDGLAADLLKICEASGVAAWLDLDRLPVAECWRDSVDADRRAHWALCGGDDYELCFTVPSARLSTLDALARAKGLQLAPVGKIRPGSGVKLVRDGKPVQRAFPGFDHFAPT